MRLRPRAQRRCRRWPVEDRRAAPGGLCAGSALDSGSLGRCTQAYRRRLSISLIGEVSGFSISIQEALCRFFPSLSNQKAHVRARGGNNGKRETTDQTDRADWHGAVEISFVRSRTRWPRWQIGALERRNFVRTNVH